MEDLNKYGSDANEIHVREIVESVQRTIFLFDQLLLAELYALMYLIENYSY